LKPKLKVPPEATVPLYDRLEAVTAAPDWLMAAFQPCVTFWLPANDQPSFQLVSALPVLVTVTEAVKPLSHWVDIE